MQGFIASQKCEKCGKNMFKTSYEDIICFFCDMDDYKKLRCSQGKHEIFRCTIKYDENGRRICAGCLTLLPATE